MLLAQYLAFNKHLINSNNWYRVVAVKAEMEHHKGRKEGMPACSIC